MAEAWTYNKSLALVEDENGLPVCIRVSDDEDGELIASAPTLAEHVRILREAAQRVTANWEDGDLADAVRELSLILESIKPEE